MSRPYKTPVPVIHENELEVFIHDLASPLTNIDLSLHLLQNQINPKHENTDIVISRAVNSLNQLNWIIAQKRSHLYTQKPKENLNILEEILYVKKSHTSSLEETAINFRVDCAYDAFVYANRYRFQQVIDNLVKNAIDALVFTKKKHKTIHLSVVIETQNIVLTVRDNGCGMNKETINKAFDLNYSTKPDHSGIGLWLIKQIITTEFNGDIEIESEIDKYTQVKLVLPKSRK